MINTIKKWIYQIKNFDKQLAEISYMKEKLQRQKEHIRDSEFRIKSLESSNNKLQDDMKRIVSLLSGNTWTEGDNMMEAIETYQNKKYLQEHGEDFMMIMNGNVPEMAIQELFEYFEIERSESTIIEDKTARALHHIWCNWYIGFSVSVPQNNMMLHKRFEDLSEKQKEKYREDARYLWYIGNQKQ